MMRSLDFSVSVSETESAEATAPVSEFEFGSLHFCEAIEVYESGATCICVTQ